LSVAVLIVLIRGIRGLRSDLGAQRAEIRQNAGRNNTDVQDVAPTTYDTASIGRGPVKLEE